MKKFLLLSILTVVFLSSSFAQSVGINADGSAPNASAMLDVKHPNKGLLIPRVALTGTGDVATIPSAATSLLVYNTATNGAGATAVTPGFYYWSGVAWLRITTGSGSPTSWQLTGNGGTIDGTNFIGTTDNVPFNIGVNGQRAGRIDPTLNNTTLGYLAGNLATTGSYNTVIGNYAFQANTNGSSNTATGAYTLWANTTGWNNTGTGSAALLGNTTGYLNTADGVRALALNTTGYQNTASGTYALMANTEGFSNTAAGFEALFRNSTGNSNVAIGVGALYSNTTVSNTIAVGDSALHELTTGIQNTAVGSKALSANTTGDYNTALGYNALRANSTGNVNTAYGVSALQNNTTGGNNTAFGSAALSANTTAYGNTAVGNGALAASTTGYFNTAIGYAADVASDALSNTIAIGSGAIVSVSNTAQIGNSSLSDIYFGSATGATLHAAAYNTPSDARFKYDIQENVPGLEFIRRLKPVTYYFDEQKLVEYMKTGSIGNGDLKPALYTEARQLHTGFLAQDVERIATELGYSFDGIHVPTNNKDYYSLSYSQFIMPLVRSVQEQQQTIEEQSKKIDSQAKEIKSMNEKIDALTKAIEQFAHK
jgi:hypothetical protein